MTKIILCCSAGMSTSLFVQKIQAHTQEIGEKINIIAVPIAELDNYLNDIDIVALAPQIRFQKDTILKNK